MAVKRLGNTKIQYDDGNGVLASNYRLFFYAAGSSTKQNTYNSSTGGVANANPVVLNALGEPASEIWLTAGQSYKVGLAIPGSDDPPAAFVWTEDNVAGVNDTTTTIDEWVGFAGVPTFVSATSFTLVGDQTTEFHVGRRVKTINSGGTVYGTIITTAFAALTTVTVANDSGVLDSGLSAVSYGLVRANNPSISPAMVNRKGAAVASAGTTNIWGVVGDYVHITGTTGITSLGTAPYAGAERTVVFDAALILTQNATTLVLPGGANITTAANDVAIVRADTTANMVVVSYFRANGVQVFASGSATGTQTANTVYAGPTSGAAAVPTFRAPVGADGSSMVLLGSKTASASASISFAHTGGTGDATFDWTAYDEYEFHFVQIVPATNATNLNVQISEDSGSTYKNGAGTYGTLSFRWDLTPASATETAASTVWTLNYNATLSNSTDYGFNGVLRMNKPSSTIRKLVQTDVSFLNSSASAITGLKGVLNYNGDTGAWTGIKFSMGAGNIASGTIYAYGIRKS